MLAPLLRSRSFLLVCGLSLGLTLLRETFNTWTPTYFVQALSLGEGAAARASGLFPALGGVSVLLAGWLGDRFGAHGRAWIIIAGLLLATLSMIGLGPLASLVGVTGSVALVGLTGFLLLAPYSYLAGAISLDFGGKAGSATACGVIDGVGYMGGILAGGGIARVVDLAGWSGAFSALAGLAFATAILGVFFLRSLPSETAAR